LFRFHAIYWPAFLLAADLPLPKKLLVHGHWLSGRRKVNFENSRSLIISLFLDVKKPGKCFLSSKDS